MEMQWILLGILCVCQYIIALILMENRNATIEKQRFVLNQTYST
jgi:hypothetical protein